MLIELVNFWKNYLLQNLPATKSIHHKTSQNHKHFAVIIVAMSKLLLDKKLAIPPQQGQPLAWPHDTQADPVLGLLRCL